MNRILIVAEHDGSRLNPAIAKCVTCARGIADAQITLAVFAADPSAVAADAAAVAGVDRVITVTHAIHANAWAHSSAGIMPSVRASSWNAEITSSSVTFGYSTRPIDARYECSGPIPG